MDKAKHLSKKERQEELTKLVEVAKTRNYIDKKLVLTVKSIKEDKLVKVHGELQIDVNENPSDESSSKTAKFEVNIFDDLDKEAVTVMNVMANLFSISEDYGDAIFEDNFFEIFQDLVKENSEIIQ